MGSTLSLRFYVVPLKGQGELLVCVAVPFLSQVKMVEARAKHKAIPTATVGPALHGAQGEPQVEREARRRATGETTETEPLIC